MKFSQQETIKKIEEYANNYIHKGSFENKVFYHYNEWNGWRFYLKAIRHRDWKSIKFKLFK